MDSGDTPRTVAHNRVMLRIDPALPALWRTPDTLQFGAQATAILEQPSAWQLRMVDELTAGMPETALEPVALALGATEPQARALLAHLRPALVPPAPPAPPRTAVRSGALVSDDDAATLVGALRTAGVPRAADVSAADTVVLVGAHVIDPRAAAALLRDDVPHLAVVLHGASITVGPFVRPGRTACLMCVEAARCDLDPAWPALAAQLLIAPVPATPAGLTAEAGLTVARMLTAPVGPARSVTLTARSFDRSWQDHPPHAACGCLSLGGTGTALADPPSRRARTRPTAIAQPA